MALKDRIRTDNHHVFMNTDHFADTHTWNGRPFTCVMDDTEAKKYNDMALTSTFSWEAEHVDKVIFVPEDSLPARAQPNEFVLLDGVAMRVLTVIDAIGMKEIRLQVDYAKGVL